jgi:hypothetical protein
VQREYCDWAERAGLKKITAYLGRPLCLGHFSGQVERVDQDHLEAVGHWIDDEMRACSWSSSPAMV